MARRRPPPVRGPLRHSTRADSVHQSRTLTDRRMTGGQGRRGAARAPAAIAVLVAIALYGVLPNTLLAGPRYAIPVLEMLLLVPLVAFNPRRLNRETRITRIVSVSLVVLVLLSNGVALGLLLNALVSSQTAGRTLLLGALEVWLTNIVGFGLLYWELDRGGPVARAQSARPQLALADFRFTQDENQDTVQEVAAGSSQAADWMPSLIDYLYVSVTNSTAFSPTDTMPLTSRAKILMAIQSVSALLISVLVISRGVGILK